MELIGCRQLALETQILIQADAARRREVFGIWGQISLTSWPAVSNIDIKN